MARPPACAERLKLQGVVPELEELEPVHTVIDRSPGRTRVRALAMVIRQAAGSLWTLPCANDNFNAKYTLTVGEMRTNYQDNRDQPKTLGPQAARLLTALHEKRRTVFTIAEVQEVTGLGPKSTRNFLGKLVQRGVATRLKPGLFNLVPFELGREREYLGNPYVAARELAGGRPYYLSHASAMDLHGMVTQPQLVVFVTSPSPLRGRSILGTEFRFVRCKPEHLLGITEHWVDKTQKVLVSDIERTVIDGLKQPEYCGGISEVAKGMWLRRDKMDISRLVDYSLRLDIGAVVRRLGFLLEVSGADPAAIDALHSRMTSTYHLLDPTLPAEGHRVSRWRLQLNVSPEELEAVRNT